MDHRGANRRTSSLRDINPFGMSFSCGEFGAFDQDLDEDDYEQMAADAEFEAIERINHAKRRDAMIEGMLESDGSVVTPSVGSLDKSRGSLPQDHTSNRRKSQGPQKIVEGDFEEGVTDSTNWGSLTSQPQAMSVSDAEASQASSSSRKGIGDTKRNALNTSEGLTRRDSTQSEQRSFYNSCGEGNSTWGSPPSSNVIKTEEKSGIVLASAPGAVPSGGIHINAPNVTINYIIKQKVGSESLPSRTGKEQCDRNGREQCEISDASLASRDSSTKDASIGSRLDSNERSGVGKNEEDRSIPKRESSAHQTVHKKKIPKNAEQIIHDELPEFVTPLAAMSVQADSVMTTDTAEDQKRRGNTSKQPPKAERDFNDSHTTMTASMSTNMSRKDGPMKSATTASLSTSTALNAPKVASVEPSQPFDLSEMLDSLWNPNTHSSGAPSTTSSVLKTQSRSRSGSESSGSGVFSAGVKSFLSNNTLHSSVDGHAERCLNNAKSSLSQMDEKRRLPCLHPASKSEGDVHIADQKEPLLKSTSSFGVRQNDNVDQRPKAKSLHQLSGCNANRRNEHAGSSSNLRLTSHRNPMDDGKVNKATKSHERENEHGCNVDVQNQLQLKSEGETARPHQKEEGESEPRGGGVTSNDSKEEQRVTWSEEPPRKQCMRNLLKTVESDHSLSIYEDLSVGQSLDKDFDPTAKRSNKVPKMEAIGENDDSISVASSVPEYKIDAEISEFARNFVTQFSKQEEDKQKQEENNQSQGSHDLKTRLMRQDGSDRSAIEELEELSNPAKGRKSGAGGGSDRKVGTKPDNRRELTPNNGVSRVSRLQNVGKSRSRSGMNDQDQLRGQKKSSKSMNARQQRRPSHDQFTHARSEPMRQSSLRCQSSHLSENSHKQLDRRKSITGSQAQSRVRRQSGSGSLCNSQNSKYHIGESLQSDNDIIRDSDVEKILCLEPLDCVFVRRSGQSSSRWTYSVVSDVNENEMRFVLDKNGSKKKIERQALLHNVRRLNYSKCFKRNERVLKKGH